LRTAWAARKQCSFYGEKVDMPVHGAW
jgi:hypothetical protein